MTKKSHITRSPLRIIVTIVAIAVVILFASAGFQIADESRGVAYDCDSRDYIYPAENGRFGNLYEVAVRDMAKRTSYSPEVEECRALAFYYEQAVLEHAYREAGNDGKADEFANRMREYEAQLGSMSSKAEVVRKLVSSDAQATGKS